MNAPHSSSRQTAWHRNAGFVAIAVISTLLGFFLSAPPARAAQEAETFVAANVEKGTGILNDTTVTASVRQERFRAFVLSITDSKRIATFTLGPYARGMSGAQLDEYVRSFSEYLTAVYQKGLDNYRGQSIRITGSLARNENDIVVNAEIIGKEAVSPPLRIAFRVGRTQDGSFVVIDLQVAGAWLALNQRSDFSAYLQQHHGDIDALSGELSKRAAQIRGADNTAPAA